MALNANETSLWKGHPSQVTNLGLYIICTLTCVLIVPIFIALWRYIVTNSIIYEVTSQRIFRTTGVFSKKTDALELYRVRDLEILQPFFLRLFGLGDIRLETSDRTDPVFLIPAVGDAKALADTIRQNVEVCRKTKGVREVDFEQ